MAALVNANLALRFLLELGALAAVGYWGWRTGDGATRPILAIAGVATVAVFWGLFLSPKRSIELGDPLRLTREFAVWTAAAAALYASGHFRLGLAFVVAAILSGSFNYARS